MIYWTIIQQICDENRVFKDLKLHLMIWKLSSLLLVSRYLNECMWWWYRAMLFKLILKNRAGPGKDGHRIDMKINLKQASQAHAWKCLNEFAGVCQDHDCKQL